MTIPRDSYLPQCGTGMTRGDSSDALTNERTAVAVVAAVGVVVLLC